MKSSLHLSPIPMQLAPCGLDCRYAEPLRANPDWIWCTCPTTAKRVHSIDSDCRWFTPPATLPPDYAR